MVVSGVGKGDGDSGLNIQEDKWNVKVASDYSSSRRQTVSQGKKVTEEEISF
jgi:hypothetical protein